MRHGCDMKDNGFCRIRLRPELTVQDHRNPGNSPNSNLIKRRLSFITGSDSGPGVGG
jgi:hypothetical protein